jgi:hypothetical protein
MRFAIAALMALFLLGAVSAQDAPSAQDTPSVQDATQSPAAAPATDTAPATEAPAADAAPAATAPAVEQAAPSEQAPAPDQAKAPDQAPAKPKNAFGFKGGVNLGSDVFYTGDPVPSSTDPTAETWTRLGFQPDLSYGKIGVGLDLTAHFMLYKTADEAITFYPGDWVPYYKGNNKNFFDVYLPKILYVRYGLKGEDPIFAKLGSVNDLSLGNGFIMSDYSNMHFLPQQRIFGLDVGVDGAAFNFPFVGIEALTGNLARFDVVGGRVFARPLVGTAIPILKNMQAGFTAVADTDPFLYEETGSGDPISAFGLDVMVPIVGSKAFTLAAFTDFAVDPNKSTGYMLGMGGRIIGIFTYGAQLRILQEGFVPAYFDANYDLKRAERYATVKGTENSAGWFATIGTSLIADKLMANATIEGPFQAKDAGDLTATQTDYPHLRGVVKMGEIEKIPFYFDASYDKYKIGAVKGFFQDLVDPTDAIIGLNINYKTGASVLTLAYDAKWDPKADSGKGKFNVTSSLQASMKF